MHKVAIYPGTFDPITYGHIDVIKKALKLFDKVVVSVSDVSNKNYLFNYNLNHLRMVFFIFLFYTRKHKSNNSWQFVLFHLFEDHQSIF